MFKKKHRPPFFRGGFFWRKISTHLPAISTGFAHAFCYNADNKKKEVSRTTYTIYWDLLFIINFTFDLLILWLVSRLHRTHFHSLRAISAAFIGGLYGIGILFPPLSLLYSLPIILLMPALLLIIATPQSNVKLLLHHLVSFYILAFALSGLVAALQTVTGRFNLNPYSVWLLFFTLIIAVPAGQKLHHWLNNRARGGICEISLQYADRQITLAALTDSGNLLTEPISGLPVVVLNAKHAAVLQPALAEYYQPELNQEDFLLRLAATGQTGWRLLPYRTIDKTNGLLLAFGPANITADHFKNQVFVAVAPQPLGSRYQAIIPGTLFDPTTQHNKGDAQ